MTDDAVHVLPIRKTIIEAARVLYLLGTGRPPDCDAEAIELAISTTCAELCDDQRWPVALAAAAGRV